MPVKVDEASPVDARKCIVCGSTHAMLAYPGILRCQECGYTFVDLYLRDDEVCKLYRKEYFFGDEYEDYVADKSVIQKNFGLRLKVLREFLNPAEHRRLLEIGSAYGFFLEIARDEFAAVLGMDITEDGVRYARSELKVDVIQADLLQYDFGDDKFDVVCMWDTIEHLQRPDLYIEKISKYMKGGSLLAITTGDIESLNARIRKKKWRLLHPPTHLHYFSKRTLTRLLGQHEFDVIYNRYCGFYRSVDNIAYNVLVLRHQRPSLYRLLKRSLLTKWDCYLNLYDILYVIARKR